MDKKPKVFEELERLAELSPAAFYWTDANSIIMGFNKNCLAIIGADPSTNYIGKSPYDMYPLEIAKIVDNNTKKVIKTGKTLVFEEYVDDLKTGKRRYYKVIRSPLIEDGKIVGAVGTPVEITDTKEKEKLHLKNEVQKIKLEEQRKFKKLVNQAAEDTKSNLAILLILIQQCSGLPRSKVFETIEKFADDVPINLYWFDENNKLMGANKQDMENTGATSITAYIGKTPYDYLPHEMADSIVKHCNLVMRAKKILSQEELFKDITTGEIKYLNSFKAPLCDNTGKIIGTLCTSIDITSEKHAEQLKLENELQKIKIQEQERFATVARGVSHDIRSPLTTLQNIVARISKNLVEKDRVGLNSVTRSITDIANNLLHDFKKIRSEVTTDTMEIQPVLVSLELAKIASEKRHQYAKSPAKINDLYDSNNGFLFIKTDPSNFDRMISNLVNNAVDAFDGKKGKVDLKLGIEKKHVKITIQDNGKGMPQEVIDKIMNNGAVTHGKKNGNGIGLAQVRSTLQMSNGKMQIDSKIGKGTKITLTFPITGVPNWIARQIVLHKGDTVVVLDDDGSIHYSWDMRFEDYNDVISLVHFRSGEKAINFINTNPEKHKIFLLSDFELIDQELNGLQVIERVSMQNRAILVTSHYANTKVHTMATEMGVKILPKQLSSEVPITIEEEISLSCSKKGYLVIIDDVRELADSVADSLRDKFAVVGVYYHPERFLENLAQYPKDTVICMDHDFKTKMNGIDLAKQLHEAGYTKLYLLSGNKFEEGVVPDYLTVLLKGDMEALLQLTNA
jgi:PAS domain S-box-containing protein